MKQQVLKALANPPRIFYVPYSLAVLNFVVQFIVFIAIYVSCLVFFKIEIPPLLFLISVMVVHMILAVYSRVDPQLGQILSARLQLFKRKIPRRLAA
jgi:type IV secretory pathway VirB3-like protein